MADSDFPSDNPVVEEHAPAMIENTNVSQIGINEDTGVCSYDVENLVNSGKRLPKLTEKGRQFQMDVAIKEFNNFLRKFKRCLKNLSVQLTIADDAGALKLAFKAAHSTSSDVENALVNLSGVMDPNDLSFYTSEYEKLDEELSAQSPKVKELLRTISHSDGSSSSSFCGSKRSAKSVLADTVCTGLSSKHESEMLRMKRVQKLEQAAALKTQLAFHKAQQDFKQRRAALDDAEQRFRLEREIAVLEASVKASRVAEERESGGSLADDLSVIPVESEEDKQKRIYGSIGDRISDPEVNLANESTSCNDKVLADVNKGKDEIEDANRHNTAVTDMQHGTTTSRNLAAIIDRPVLSYRLPDVKIQPFDGNIVDYPAWEIAFNAIVDGQVNNIDLKINLLSQHLTGDARSLVIGLLSQRTKSSYDAARKRLKDRYGNPSILCQAFLDKIEDWPIVKPNQPRELQRFSDMLMQIAELRKGIGGLQILDFPQETKKILRKLPVYFDREWRESVCSWRDKHGLDSYPSFDDLVHFVERRATRANIPELQQQNFTKQATTKGSLEKRIFVKDVRALATTAEGNSKNHDMNCTYCHQGHHINDCPEFANLSREECLKFLQEKGFCFGCGSSSEHVSKNCSNRVKCKTCGKFHLSALHISRPEENADSRCTSVCSMKDQSLGSDNSMILPVWARSKQNPDKEILVYCILDDQSNTCFISNKLRSQLKLTGHDTTLSLSTMDRNQSYIACKKVVDLEIVSFDRKTCIPLSAAFTRGHIPASRSQIPKPEIARQWDHLKDVANEIYPYHAEADIAILIGNNVPKATRPRAVIAGNEEEPYAQRSILGWGIIGTVCHSVAQKQTISVSNRISAAPVTIFPLPRINQDTTSSKLDNGGLKLVFATQVKEVINPHEVKKMFEIDFNENNDNHNMSVEDQKFINLMKTETKRHDDGRYIIPLPVKSSLVTLPNNRPLAMTRLRQLEKRFKKNLQLKEDYVAFMDQLIENYAEKVPTLPTDCTKHLNYIPHSGVYHPKKPNKIRVVFDCSAKYGGVCLNDYLLTGPSLLNDLIAVFCRFRKEEVALVADIESMFLRFYVREQDRDLLRFLWWSNGDPANPVCEYRLKVHLFGAGSSPACANFGLKRAADDGENEFGEGAANFVRDEFYMDDGLISLPTEQEAISIAQDSIALCAKAGLRLHKFMSNRRSVLEEIPEEARAQSLKTLDIQTDPLPFERTLGVTWCVENDVFQFKIELKDTPLTRRGILSTVCSIFDPVGFVAPFVLEGKKILQQLCKTGSKWDDPVPEQLEVRWRKWRKDVVRLGEFQVRRCLKPDEFGEVIKTELHHFSDACSNGYGQCSYLRMTNSQGDIHCAFVMGKSRVAPLKQVTIPRLELTAAVVSAKIGKYLVDTLKYSRVHQYFWVDSKIVLGYVSNEAKRFNTYVANRIQQIRDLSSPESWFYVPSQDNPGDDASRGLDIRHMVSESRWLNGPDFLWKSLDERLNSSADCISSKEIGDLLQSEMRKATSFSAAACSVPIFDVERLQVFSSWFHARRAVANCILLVHRLVTKARCRLQKKNEPTSFELGFTVKNCDLQLAEVEIMKGLQFRHFGEEIAILQNQADQYEDRVNHRRKDASLKRISSLYRLDPFLDNDGILRVGGRIKRANIPERLSHPIVLPQRSHITSLIIDHFHKEVNHMGRGATHSNVRQNGFWVIGGSSAVACFVGKCVTCKRLRGSKLTQKMADLPVDRMSEEPPFTYSAVDFFGPFYVKERRSLLKRYGVIFLCMSSRAVHLECANSLEADSFINVLRRFLARRGPVMQLRSDCGTNLVGANNELKKALLEMDRNRVKNHLLKNNCDWVEFKFNVPHSSHMAGSWERQIRTVRNALEPLLLKTGSQLDDDSFRTFLVEVENVVNSRPLTTEDICDPTSLEPLTPNHLLTMKSKLLLPPPGKFVRADLYARKRWRRVQYLSNIFWNRWRKEILHNLQARTKWVSSRRNVKIGDIITFSDDDDTPRNKWKLARVEEVYPSEDGRVRKVRLRIADSELDRHGKRTKTVTFLDRPVHKLVLLITADNEG